jgi:hypothetical protein
MPRLKGSGPVGAGADPVYRAALAYSVSQMRALRDRANGETRS